MPLKTDGEKLDADINKIYDKCYKLGLDNNREVIKEIINNTIFKNMI